MKGRGEPARGLACESWGPEDVRMLREDLLLGMSRAKFAALIGVCELTVIRWERPEGDADGTRPEPHNAARLDLLVGEVLAAPMIALPENMSGRAGQQYVECVERMTALAVSRYLDKIGKGAHA